MNAVAAPDPYTTSSARPARDAPTFTVLSVVINGVLSTSDDRGVTTLTAAVDELDQILGDRAVRAVYQPVIELATGRTVGFEALARGPEGSELERPDRLFAAARAAGRLSELDWVCRAAALRGALDARLGRSVSCSSTWNQKPSRYRRRRGCWTSSVRRADTSTWWSRSPSARWCRPRQSCLPRSRRCVTSGGVSPWTTSAPT